MRKVLSTYRLQLHADFTAHDAAALVPYLSRLGVSHIFCSPVLQAAPGSRHGYDVVDHSRISSDIGGEAGLRKLADTAHAAGIGLVVDVVPNHMAVPSPVWHNQALWSVLKEGSESPYAKWFDVDLHGSGAILMPVLGDKIGNVLGRGEITLDTVEIPLHAGSQETRSETVVRYYDHVFPVAPHTENLPLADLLERQWYRLAYWKVADDELNYRRFFDVDTLAAIRVEEPEVFAASHELLLKLHAEGVIDGFRIDHPDGLADPRGYLRDLAEASDNAWVVVEKILEGEETLPQDMPCAGTTGYDALWRVGGLFHDPRGADALTVAWQQATGDVRTFGQVAAQAKQEIVANSLYAEVRRLTDLAYTICQYDIRLRDHTRRQLESCILALLQGMDRYRAYIVPTEPAPAAERAVIAEAAERAKRHLDEEDLDTLELVVALACGDEAGSAGRTNSPRRREFVIRFAQTCGPVQAKSLEDTAFYRYNRFVGVNEVGSDPRIIGVDPDELHEHARRMVHSFPDSMTTLSTHDTKRSEDTRARLAVLTEMPHEWLDTVTELREATAAQRGALVDPGIETLFWQTLAACWELPGSEIETISEERLTGYLLKAMREAKLHTTWTAQNSEYESQVSDFARAALKNEKVAEVLTQWTRKTLPHVRTAVLGQKLIQLTMPGVPDVYQGQERIDISLVDPDNRRPVNHELAAERLERMLSGARPEGLADEKQFLTHSALRLRREKPEFFHGRDAAYLPIATTTGHAVAFARVHASDAEETPAAQDARNIGAITVITRLGYSLAHRGGWRDDTVVLPAGHWRDLLTGETISGGAQRLSDLLASWPVALLVPADSQEDPGA
ncbi:malto-oligosyltrehalose synthase [Dermabacteraceae bacterium TAE3-ERU27]|nr:malto-oligosyltrehalose synthase [Dermabacteraceae bacterium TAE3-ERU27]